MIDVQMKLRVRCHPVRKDDQGVEWCSVLLVKATRRCTFPILPPERSMFTIGNHPARYRIERWEFREGEQDIEGKCVVIMGQHLQDGSDSPEQVEKELKDLGWEVEFQDISLNSIRDRDWRDR